MTCTHAKVNVPSADWLMSTTANVAGACDAFLIMSCHNILGPKVH